MRAPTFDEVAAIVRPIFFAPWWWFFWSGGKRFSLRRALSLAAAVVVGGELLASGFRFAFHGIAPTVAYAEHTAIIAAIASAAYSLLEPALFVIGDSIRAGTWRPERLQAVSYGLQFAYAAGAAFGTYAFAPHVAALATLLVRAHEQNGWLGGNLRFLIGATIVYFPLVILARILALQTPRAPQTTQTARVTPQASRKSIPFRDERRIAHDPVTPPIVPLVPRSARIISVDVGPAEPPDRP